MTKKTILPTPAGKTALIWAVEDAADFIYNEASNKEYDAYQQYQRNNLHSRILTPDSLRIICAGLDNNPEKIGIHMLEMLAKSRNEGIAE